MTRKSLKTSFLATALLFVGLAVAPRAGQAPNIDITGTWIFDVVTDAGASAPMVTFKQEGEKVTGHYSSQTLGEADLAGTLKGQDLTFTFMGNLQGMSVPVTYNATVSSHDAMKGTLDIAMVAQGTFSARPAQLHGEVESIPPTSAADARQMFQTYCAACHGKEGKGDGPVAKTLKATPPDLTKLSARNRGTFPAIKVRRSIEGAIEVPAHGTPDMPVWGALFVGLDHDPALKELRIDKLTDYLQSIQK